jgi:hypothetical protein
MDIEKETKLVNLNKEIEQLDIKENEKMVLYKVAKGIIASSKNKLFVIDRDDYQEYLCFKIPNNTKDIKFCISKVIIEQSGAKTKSNDFPSYKELIEYINKYKKEIASELNTLNYQQEQQPQSETPTTSIVRVLKERVEKISAPANKKTRAIAVLNELASEDNKKIYTVREETYEEYLSIVNGILIVTEKIIDYAGTTQAKNTYLLKSKELIEYIDEHKELIDETIGKTK